MFLVGDPNLNLHLPLLLRGGTTQHITWSCYNVRGVFGVAYHLESASTVGKLQGTTTPNPNVQFRRNCHGPKSCECFPSNKYIFHLFKGWIYNLPGTPRPTIYKWLFQLDDFQSLHRKWLFHQTSIYKWLFGVPGTYKGVSYNPLYTNYQQDIPVDMGVNPKIGVFTPQIIHLFIGFSMK